MKKNNMLVYWLLTIFLMTSCSSGGGTAVQNQASARGTATLTWIAPTENSDDSLLTDLKGYKVYYGNTTGHYDHVIDVGSVRTWKLENLPAGNYVFIVRAYNQAGVESDFSNEQGKTIP